MKKKSEFVGKNEFTGRKYFRPKRVEATVVSEGPPPPPENFPPGWEGTVEDVSQPSGSIVETTSAVESARAIEEYQVKLDELRANLLGRSNERE